MTDRELMQMALDALILNNQKWKALADSGDYGYWKAEDQDHYHHTELTTIALRERLAQPETDDLTAAYMSGLHDGKKKREWVGLTDGDIAQTMQGSVEGSNMLPYQFARAIEAKLKEKNV